MHAIVGPGCAKGQQQQSRQAVAQNADQNCIRRDQPAGKLSITEHITQIERQISGSQQTPEYLWLRKRKLQPIRQPRRHK